MGPLQMRGLLMFLPQFVRVFWRLMHDTRVSALAKAVPFLGVLALLSPPLLELESRLKAFAVLAFCAEMTRLPSH